MSGITSSTALWYASRTTGIISLVLLTAVMVLGILVYRIRETFESMDVSRLRRLRG